MHLACVQRMSIWSCWQMRQNYEALNKLLINYRSRSSTALLCITSYLTGNMT